MTHFVPLWTRAAPPRSGRAAESILVAFASQELAELKLEAARFGVPSVESMDTVDIREIARSADPEWFDGWRSGAVRVVARHDLGDDLALLDRADRAFWVAATVLDPPDFGYLQASWAVARWLVARGASHVLDVQAAHFWSAEKIAGRPPDERFDVRREVTLIFETDATEARGGHCLHTRGMKKLGCPDLVAVVGPDDAELVGEVLWQLAEGLTEGFEPVAPRHGVDLPDGQSLYLCTPRAEDPAERLELNNHALMLVREDGGSLVGLVGGGQPEPRLR